MKYNTTIAPRAVPDIELEALSIRFAVSMADRLEALADETLTPHDLFDYFFYTTVVLVGNLYPEAETKHYGAAMDILVNIWHLGDALKTWLGFQADPWYIPHDPHALDRDALKWALNTTPIFDWAQDAEA